MRTSRSAPWRRPLEAAVAALVLSVLAACAGGPAVNDVSESGEMLENSLPVAAAALAAGQPDVARRLYLSLAERFEEAPEPVLGLGYIAFHNRDLSSAERYFLEAAERASEAPAAKAEALLGAGRSALSQDRPSAARKHLERARESGRDTPSAPWIANGLAVVAALEEDYGEAEAHYAEAMRLSSGDPRVGANLVRMRVAAGRIEDAARAYAGQVSSYWVEDDGRTLARLIEDARRERRAQAPPQGAEGTPRHRPGPVLRAARARGGRDRVPTRGVRGLRARPSSRPRVASLRLRSAGGRPGCRRTPVLRRGRCPGGVGPHAPPRRLDRAAHALAGGGLRRPAGRVLRPPRPPGRTAPRTVSPRPPPPATTHRPTRSRSPDRRSRR